MSDSFGLFASRMIRALSRLRDIHPEMTLLQAQTFLAIAETPDITQRELYALLGTNDSVASRTVAILSDLGSRNTAPLGLIEMRLNPVDRRQKFLTLTKKGQRLAEDIRGDITKKA